MFVSMIYSSRTQSGGAYAYVEFEFLICKAQLISDPTDTVCSVVPGRNAVTISCPAMCGTVIQAKILLPTSASAIFFVAGCSFFAHRPLRSPLHPALLCVHYCSASVTAWHHPSSISAFLLLTGVAG